MISTAYNVLELSTIECDAQHGFRAGGGIRKLFVGGEYFYNGQ